MRSIPKALLWEMLVRGRWSVPGLFLVGNGLPLLAYGSLWGLGVNFADPTLPFFALLIVSQFSFLPLIMLQFAIGIAIAQGPMSRLFAWPITSNAIVAWHTLSGAVVLALETGLAASLYNWLFHAEWPIVGPMLFAGVAWSAVQLLQFIRMQSSLSGFCLWSSPSLLLSFWLMSRYGSFLSPPTHYWREVTFADMLALVIVAAICYGMALIGVSFARSGGQLPQLGVSQWLIRQWESLTLGSSVPSNFRSIAHAQNWYEYKLRGWVLPFISSIVTSFVILAITTGAITRDWNIEEGNEISAVIPALLTWASLFPLVWGFLFAIEDSSNAGEKRDKGLGDIFDPITLESMGSFLAVRPIENRMISKVILWTIAKSTASMLFPVVPVLLAIGLANRMPALLTLPGLGAWWLPLLLISPWICMANAASIAFIAHRGATYLLGGLEVVGFLLLAARIQFASDVLVQLLVVTSSAISIVIIILTIWVFDRSRRAHQLTAQTQMLCLAIVLAIIGAAFFLRPIDPPVVAYPLTLAVAALAVLPFASLPLTIGASRHR